MTSRETVESYRARNQGIRERLVRELESFWSRNQDRETLKGFLARMITRYGDEAAQAGAEFYDRLREEAGVDGSFTATPAPRSPQAAVETNVNWSTIPLETGDFETALDRSRNVVDRMVLERGRESVSHNIDRDRKGNARFARVPTGAETCEFCLILASRGFVYLSDKTAGFRRSDFDTYHPSCDCTPVAEFSNDPLLEGYDPDRFYDIYLAAREEAGSGDIRDIAAALRAMRKDKSLDDIRREYLEEDTPSSAGSTERPGQWVALGTSDLGEAQSFIDRVLSPSGSWDSRIGPNGMVQVRRTGPPADTVESVLAGRPRVSPVDGPAVRTALDRADEWSVMHPLSPDGRRILERLNLVTAPPPATWVVAGANPNYGTGETDYRINDVQAAAAVELRMRGWDVVARPAVGSAGATPEQAAAVWLGVSWQREVSSQEEFIGRVLALPDGARGVLTASWDRSYGGGRHMLNWVRENGSVTFLDGSLGVVYGLAILAGVAFSEGVEVTRLDDATLANLAVVALAGEDDL